MKFHLNYCANKHLCFAHYTKFKPMFQHLILKVFSSFSFNFGTESFNTKREANSGVRISNTRKTEKDGRTNRDAKI